MATLDADDLAAIEALITAKIPQAFPNAVPGAAGGVFIAGTNAATTITTALTTTFTGNLTGSVGSIANGGIAAASFANDAITAASINTGAFTADAFAADAIVAATLATGALTADAFAADAIVAATLATGAITADALGADCITNAAIADDAIAAENLKTGAITADAFAADAIVAATLATGCITADAIAAAAIANAAFASDVASVSDVQNGLATTTELAKVPKSDSNVTWNSTALASINAEVDTALNTAIPGSPTANSVNERVAAIDDLTQASGAGDLAAIVNRIGAWTGTGVNTILGAFKALLSKAASAPSDIGGTFDPAADSTEAIRDRGDAAYLTATGFELAGAAATAAAGVPAATVSALGTGSTLTTLATATALADVPTNTEFELRTLPAADYVVVGDTIAGVTTVGSVTGSVGSVGTGGITTGSFAAGAINAAAIGTAAIDADAIATDAFGALELAAGAATEIANAVAALISTTDVTVSSPVATDGTITIYEGDSYPASLSRQISFAVVDASHLLGLDGVTCDVYLRLQEATWTGTATSTTPGYTVVFTPTIAQTAALTSKRQKYKLIAIYDATPDEAATLAEGTVILTADIPAVA